MHAADVPCVLHCSLACAWLVLSEEDQASTAARLPQVDNPRHALLPLSECVAGSGKWMDAGCEAFRSVVADACWKRLHEMCVMGQSGEQ